MEPNEKPTIVIDVDGVITNFSNEFAKYYNQYKKPLHKPISNNPPNWNFDLEGIELQCMYKMMNQFIMTDYEKLKYEYELLGNWASLTNKLASKYKIIIVTSYPNHESRTKYLAHKGIIYNDIHFSNSSEKYEIIKKINPKFVVEDNPEIIINLAKELPRSKILYPAIWKYLDHMPKTIREQNLSNVSQYHNLEEFETLV